MYRLRPCEDRDFDRIAEIRNCILPEPATAEEIRQRDAINTGDPTQTFQRWVAVDGDDQVHGYGFFEHQSWMADGFWSISASVHPESRGRGVGTLIFAAMQKEALDRGATKLEAWCRGTDDHSFAWLERRGYYLDRQRTEAVLYLDQWDGTPFEGDVARVAESGIRLVGLDQIDSDALYQSMYECDKETSPDVPAFNGEGFPSYEQWLREYTEDPTGKFFALAFDGDRVVGMSITYYPKHPAGAVHTGYTATLRAYRSRGIALALKVMTINRAKADGCPRMRTNNDPDNPSMLAVNRKLGYQFVPGPRRLYREIQA